MIHVRNRRATLAATCLMIGAALFGAPARSVAAERPLPVIDANDNQRAAGTLENGTLQIALRAAVGRWQPEGPGGPSLEIEAFGEIGRSLTVPGPLIRVVEGTEIAISIRNELGAELVVHGLCSRGGAACATAKVAAQQTREFRFMSGPAGTYHYWASTVGAPIPFRELAGAFVVDRPLDAARPDRILVITEWTNLSPQQLRRIITSDSPGETFVSLKPRVTFVINGLSWPATERFTYRMAEPVRWRVINLSSQAHPLHLHGFYFDVDSLGNGQTDAIFDAAGRRRVVTQLLPSGGTMTMTWMPEREGNWLFHCHIMHHVSPARRLIADAATHAHHGATAHAAGEGPPDESLGMAGMVVGVTVSGPARSVVGAPADTTAPARKLTLVMERQRDARSDVPLPAGFALHDGGAFSSTAATAPGPPIVLKRNEPVEITLVNRLDEATSIHWHGMEIESYYDGVHGWSGVGREVTPMIEPGASFVVRFTPPRAGTFIYHTHLHDYRQLSSGLYGPLVVIDPGDTFDPVTDHVVVLGRSGLTSEEPSLLTDPASVVINGEHSPRFVWRAGTRHRIRLVNITPDDIFSVRLQMADVPAMWTPVAKDGARLPAGESIPAAARQTIAVGETYDFEYDAPDARTTLWLEVRTTGGKWQAQAQVVVR
jgi:FtsP/CotA-like multicopper oxidase with cupredoxin domain